MENAFDDVSFENDDESISNASPTYLNHSSFFNSSNRGNELKNVQNGVLSDAEQNGQGNFLENFSNSSKRSKNSSIKRMNFSSESENYSDQCRKKMQNGNLHDVVDASGGGDVTDSAHFPRYLQKSPISK